MLAAEETSTSSGPFSIAVILVSLVSGGCDAAFSSVPAVSVDEAFTALASKLGLHDFWNLVLVQKDGVNATYDLLMRPWIFTAGHSVLALRAPSALFMALACGGIMTISRFLVGSRVAVFVGVVFAVLPIATGFGSDARAYAMSAALATWSTWFFLCLVYDRRHVRRWSWCYGVSLVVTGYVFLYALLIIVVHLLVAASDAKTRLRLRWVLLIQGSAAIAVLPLMVLAWRERRQISWIPSGFKTMISNGVGVFVRPFSTGISKTGPPSVILALLVWGVIVWGSLQLAREVNRSDRALVALRLGFVWAVLPGILLSLSSATGPYFALRYIVFCAPAAALLLGVAISQVDRIAVRGGIISVMALLVIMADAPLVSSSGRNGWGTTVKVLGLRGAPGEFVLPANQTIANEARVSGLPHGMTLIDGGGDFGWTSGISVRHWISAGPPPTHVIWLVSTFDVLKCSELTTLKGWGFALRAIDGTAMNPTYEFVSLGHGTPIPLTAPCKR